MSAIKIRCIFAVSNNRRAAQLYNHCTEIMKRSEYKEKSATAQGRKSLHNDLISEIKQRMDSFVDNAPEDNKDKARVLFDKALIKMVEMGNSILFDFFVDDQISDVDFIRHTQQVISNKF